MAQYISVRGEEPDGVCLCGKPATTEIQVGWARTPAPGGPQVREVCDECHVEHFSDSNY